MFEYVIVTWIVLVLVRCVAVAFSPPPSYLWLRAIIGGLAACDADLARQFACFRISRGGAARRTRCSAPGDFHAGSEAVLAAQSYLLDHALENLSDDRKGETDLFFVGVRAVRPAGRRIAPRSRPRST